MRRPAEAVEAVEPAGPALSVGAPPRRRRAGAVLTALGAACVLGVLAIVLLHLAPAANAQDVIGPAPSATPVAAAPPPAGGGAAFALWSVVIVLLLTLLNGAFSMGETALISIRRTRVDQLVEEGRRGALTVRRLVENPPRFIATTQVGITLLGFASAAAAATRLSEPIVPLIDSVPGIGHRAADTIAVVVVTIAVALVTMVLGEIGPKSLAAQAPDVWALRLAPFINLCASLFTPITSLVVAISNVLVRPFGAKAQFETPMITREEFEKIIEGGEKHGEIDDEEADIITNVLDLSETPVRSVMTPRVDMTALPVDSPFGTILETILTSGHSRIPVYEGTTDTVVGIVHAKDLLPLFRENRRDVNVLEVMRAPYFVPETKRVSELLTEMRRSNQQIALVQDEYGGTEGIVTLEDLLEEIVGDIKDEYDVDEPDVQVLSPTESIIDGRMSLDDVNDRLGTDLADNEVNTIGGLMLTRLGHEPVAGEHFRLEDMEFVVERMDGHRVSSVRAIRLAHNRGDGDGSGSDGGGGEESPRPVPTLVP